MSLKGAILGIRPVPVARQAVEATAGLLRELDTNGLPSAIQLAGPPGSETTIISLAAQIERARPWAQLRPALA